MTLFSYVVVSAIVLFMYADVSLATSINFVFTYGEYTQTIGPALAFSVVIIAIDSFEAGAYLIAACIAVLSIAWPFVKLITLLIAWRAPADVLSHSSRERLLMFLDEYGKWSLIDTWLGILALACYKLAWHSSSGEASFVVDPVPEIPFFMFVFASILTLVLGHIASGYHRLAAEWDLGPCRSYVAEHEENRRLLEYTEFGTARRLIVGIVATTYVVLAGAFVTSFQMVESGALATLMLDEPDKVASYSLIGLGQALTKGKSRDIGLRMVQLIFFTFALFIPLALQGALLALCVLPLSHSRQLLLFDMCRALDAWAAFDVFATAVTVSHLEFGLFSSFLMHYNNLAQGCRLVKDYLHTECFHMECGLTPGYAFLLAGAVLSYATPKLAFKVCQAAIDTRADSASNPRLRRATTEGSSISDVSDEDD